MEQCVPGCMIVLWQNSEYFTPAVSSFGKDAQTEAELSGVTGNAVLFMAYNPKLKFWNFSLIAASCVPEQ